MDSGVKVENEEKRHAEEDRDEEDDEDNRSGTGTLLYFFSDSCFYGTFLHLNILSQHPIRTMQITSVAKI